MAKSRSPAAVVTGRVRFSYCYLNKSRKNDRDEDKFSTTIILPKSDKETYKKLRDAEAYAARKKFPGKSDAFYKQLKSVIYDGNGLRPSGEEFGSECKDAWVFTVSSNEKPILVDADLEELMSPINSGDYGRVSLMASGFDNNGNRGVGFYINKAQLLERGESLAGHTSVEDDFGDEEF